MMSRYTLIFPGQGAQAPGMGKTFYDSYQEAKDVFHEADDILKRHLSHQIFSGSEAELTETKTSQPAIFVTSLAILKVLEKQFGITSPVSTCGLSLGEYTALVAGKYLDFPTALSIVAERGKLMHEACESTVGSMRVVLGLSDEEVEAETVALGMPHDVWCANFNCPGQVVISGTLKGLDALEASLKAKGAKRVIPLTVHGAFHSGLMKSAQVGLKPYIQNAPIQSSEIHLAMNVSGHIEKEVERIKVCLIEQVTSSVRWHKCIGSCVQSGTDLFIEIGPGKTLAGMNKRSNILQPTISIETINDLEAIENYFKTSSKSK